MPCRCGTEYYEGMHGLLWPCRPGSICTAAFAYQQHNKPWHVWHCPLAQPPHFFPRHDLRCHHRPPSVANPVKSSCSRVWGSPNEPQVPRACPGPHEGTGAANTLKAVPLKTYDVVAKSFKTRCRRWYRLHHAIPCTLSCQVGVLLGHVMPGSYYLTLLFNAVAFPP